MTFKHTRFTYHGPQLFCGSFLSPPFKKINVYLSLVDQEGFNYYETAKEA